MGLYGSAWTTARWTMSHGLMHIQCPGRRAPGSARHCTFFYYAGFDQGLLANSPVSRVQGENSLFDSVRVIPIRHTSVRVVRGSGHFSTPHGQGAAGPVVGPPGAVHQPETVREGGQVQHHRKRVPGNLVGGRHPTVLPPGTPLQTMLRSSGSTAWKIPTRGSLIGIWPYNPPA